MVELFKVFYQVKVDRVYETVHQITLCLTQFRIEFHVSRKMFRNVTFFRINIISQGSKSSNLDKNNLMLT